MPVNSLELDTTSHLVCGTKYEVPKRYRLDDPIGNGSYGITCAAFDEEAQEQKAIKKIENIFDHSFAAHRTLRELRILRHLQHENLLDLSDVFLTGQKEDFEDVYLVCGLMETDLGTVLKSSHLLSGDHCRFFLYQILRGLKYMHSAGIVHRDLRPQTLLINASCDLKISGFGLAMHADLEYSWKGSSGHRHEYICASRYRAPEGLGVRSWSDFSPAVDVWSTACIFSEMLQRKPLFLGSNTQHQLELIISLVGTPGPEELKRIPRDNCRRFIQTLPVVKRRLQDDVALSEDRLVGLQKRGDTVVGTYLSGREMVVIADAEGAKTSGKLRHALADSLYTHDEYVMLYLDGQLLDDNTAIADFEQIVVRELVSAGNILSLMLRWSPEKRLTVEDALQHAYLAELYCPEDEPTRDRLDVAEFEFERRKLTLASLREEIFLETLTHHPELQKRYLEEQEEGEPYKITNCRLLDDVSSSDGEGD